VLDKIWPALRSKVKSVRIAAAGCLNAAVGVVVQRTTSKGESEDQKKSRNSTTTAVYFRLYKELMDGLEGKVDWKAPTSNR